MPRTEVESFASVLACDKGKDQGLTELIWGKITEMVGVR